VPLSLSIPPTISLSHTLPMEAGSLSLSLSLTHTLDTHTLGWWSLPRLVAADGNAMEAEDGCAPPSHTHSLSGSPFSLFLSLTTMEAEALFLSHTRTVAVCDQQA